MSGAIIIGTVVTVAFAYLLIERWQIRASECAREELVSVAQEMLGSPSYPDVQKDIISDMLDEAMDRWFMVQMVVRLPWMVWRVFRSKGQPPKGLVLDDRFSRFLALHSTCTAAANPFFAFIFRVELAIVVLFVGVLLASSIVVATAARVANKLSNGAQGNSFTDVAPS